MLHELDADAVRIAHIEPPPALVRAPGDLNQPRRASGRERGYARELGVDVVYDDADVAVARVVRLCVDCARRRNELPGVPTVRVNGFSTST
jgi:hypothetical protein